MRTDAKHEPALPPGWATNLTEDEPTGLLRHLHDLAQDPRTQGRGE